MPYFLSIIFHIAAIVAISPALAQQQLLPDCHLTDHQAKVRCDIRFSDPGTSGQSAKVTIKLMPPGRSDDALPGTRPTLPSSADGSAPSLVIAASSRGNRMIGAEVAPTEDVRKAGSPNWWRTLLAEVRYIYGGGAAMLVALLGMATRIFWRRRRMNAIGTGGGVVLVPGQAKAVAAAIAAVSSGDHDTVQDPPGPAKVGSSTLNKETLIVSGASAADKTSYAWLERLDTLERIPIKETTVRIGRHVDNDLQFGEESIHRQHAILHMTAKREFIITNLSGPAGNGVVVNSDRLEKHSLQDGDRIKLGEVQLRFHITPAY